MTDRNERPTNGVEERFLKAATAGDGCLAKAILDEVPVKDWRTFLEQAESKQRQNPEAGMPKLGIHVNQPEFDSNPDHIVVQLLRARNERSYPELILSAAVDTKTGSSLGDGMNSIDSKWPNSREPFCQQSKR